MKKLYIQPVARLMDMEVESMLCGSDEIVSDKGINYGGIDTGGDKDPDAREVLFDRGGRSSDVWDEW